MVTLRYTVQAAILLGIAYAFEQIDAAPKVTQTGLVNGEEAMPEMMMMMYMSFWKGPKVTWLFKNLESETDGQYTLGLIVSILLGIILEAALAFRNGLQVKAQLSAIEEKLSINR